MVVEGEEDMAGVVEVREERVVKVGEEVAVERTGTWGNSRL